MNKLVVSWHNEDGRLVCLWSEPEDSNREPAIPAEAPSHLSKCWNADVVFELGDAA